VSGAVAGSNDLVRATTVLPLMMSREIAITTGNGRDGDVKRRRGAASSPGNAKSGAAFPSAVL
jgi:hypothetical protein